MHGGSSADENPEPHVRIGWKSLEVLELTALPSIDEEHWVPMVLETDVLLVGGGDTLYLCYWMRQSGLVDLLPSLRKAVYVGLSAGSVVMAPNIGGKFVRWRPPTGGDETQGMVDFSMFPHVDNEEMPDFSMADAERWAAGNVGACVRDRRSDRHTGDRRHRRSRLRGALEALCPVIPRSSGDSLAISGLWWPNLAASES
jgi:hypothetical protein